MNDDEALTRFTRGALDNGASGVIFGRNAWQREGVTGGIERLVAIVHGRDADGGDAAHGESDGGGGKT